MLRPCLTALGGTVALVAVIVERTGEAVAERVTNTGSGASRG